MVHILGTYRPASPSKGFCNKYVIPAWINMTKCASRPSLVELLKQEILLTKFALSKAGCQSQIVHVAW